MIDGIQDNLSGAGKYSRHIAPIQTREVIMKIFPMNFSKSANILSVVAIGVGVTISTVPGAAYAHDDEHANFSDIQNSSDIQVPGHQPLIEIPARQIDGFAIDGAVNVIGFDGAKSNIAGRLTFDGREMKLAAGKEIYSVPFGSIRSFTIEHSNKGLMRGTKGMVASFAPQGVGQLYSVFRPGAETLTITYVDENQGLHGAALLLPKSRKEDVLRAFADAGLTPTAPELVDAPDLGRGVGRDSAAMRHMTPDEQRSVEVAYPQSSVQGVPAAYIVGTYEELIAQITKSGSFADVYRQGDDRVDASALNLTTNISKVKKGNAGLRGAVPVIGMIVGKAQIQANVRLTDANGSLLLNKDMKG